jgi:hypothetical protein
MNGTGRPTNQPADYQYLLAAHGFRNPSRRQVADGFRNTEADNEGDDGGFGDEPELLFTDQWNDGSFQPDHHSHEYIDQDQERKLANVLP